MTKKFVFRCLLPGILGVIVASSCSAATPDDRMVQPETPPATGASQTAAVVTEVLDRTAPTEGVTQPIDPGPVEGPTAAPPPAFDPAGLNAGPGRGFVVLDDPQMVPGASAEWLAPDEIVLGVVQNGEAQAFPVSQMAYHHIANTTIGGEPYLVTY